MKLEMKFTERDKKLLIFLAVVVILFLGGYCGVKPILTAREKIKDEITSQEATKKENEYKIARLSDMEKNYLAAAKKIDTVKENFFDMMTSNELDKMFTSKAMKRKLEIYDLNISMTGKNYEIVPYPYSEEAVKILLEKAKKKSEEQGETAKPSEKKAAAAEDAANKEAGNEMSSDEDSSSDDGEDSSLGKATIAPGVSVANITMNLVGSPKELKGFIDELTAEDYKIRLTSFAFANQENASMDNGMIDMKKIHAMTVNFEVYMYAKRTKKTAKK